MSNKRPVALDHTHEPATTTYDGFLSKTDKQIVDALRGQKPAYDALIETTGEPTGFTNNENINVSYDPTTRKVTLTGTFEAYYKGVRLTALKDGWVSDAHADVAGNYYLYYCDTGWHFDTTPWTFACLMVAFIQYNTHDLGIREVHGFMHHIVHEELHRVIGSFKRSGGDFTGYVLNSTVAAERRPDISDISVQDEDLVSVVLALSSKTYTQRYLTGSAVRTFTTGASDIVPLSGSQPYWNENVAGTWQQTLFSNNSYGAIFVVALPTTSDAGSQAFRYMFVQPQKNSASLAEIQALTPNDLTHGDSSNLVSEFVFIGKIIIRYTGGNWSITQVDKIEGTRNSQVSTSAGNYLSIVSHDTTLSGEGTAISPLSVVNDGHTHDGRYYTEAEITSLLSGKQNTLVSGTNIKTINGSSILGSGDLTVIAQADVLFKQDTAPFSNLLSNGDFSNGTTGWSLSNVTASVTDGEVTSTATASNGNIAQLEPLTAGNIYYLAVYAKNDSTSVTHRLYDGSTFIILINATANSTYTWYSGRATSANTANGTIQFNRDGRTSAWTAQYAKDVILIDLTATYGAGNEPSKEEMDARIQKLWLDTNDNELRFFDGGGWKLFKGDYSGIFDDSGTYRGYQAKGGSPTGYMRTPSEGLLPYASIASGSGYVGTPAWPFLNMYGINIYQDGNKVLAVAGEETTNPRTLKMSDGTIIKSGSASVTTAITAAYGGGFYVSSTITITFDTSFPFTVAPSVTPFITGAVDVSYLSVSVSTTNFVIKLWKYGSTASASYTVYYNAIGR